MIFKNIDILDENFDIQKNVDVLVEDSVIKKIGKDLSIDNNEIYDGKNKLLMPGFVNTHTHTPMSLLRGVGEDLPLKEWLEDAIWPREDKLDGKDCYYGTMLSIAEMIKSGTTSFSDMYFFCEDIAKAVIESGMKGNLSRALVFFDDSSLYDNERFKESLELFDGYNGASDGKIKVDFAVHDEYTMTKKSLAEFFEYVNKNNHSVVSHISETQYQHNECKKRHEGKTPVELYASLGAFKTRTTLAHGVYLEDSDLKILSNKEVYVSHCIESNLKLGSGVARIPTMLEKGVKVTIGTDGCASNNDLDMLGELKTAVLVQKGVNKNSTLLDKKLAFKLATLEGAKSQGREDVGLIKEGYRADLVVYDTDKLHFYPKIDILSNLLYAGKSSDVELTMVDGKVLYSNGEFKTIDIEKILSFVKKFE